MTLPLCERLRRPTLGQITIFYVNFTLLMLIGVTNDNHDYSQNIKFSNFTTWGCVEKENIATQAPVTRPVLSFNSEIL